MKHSADVTAFIVSAVSGADDNSSKVGTFKPKSQRTSPSTTVGRTLIVTGFPEGVTKKQFYKCCRKFGEVEQLEFPVEGKFSLCQKYSVQP